MLQDVLRRFLTSQGSIPVDYATEIHLPTAKGIPFQEFQSCPLFIWYDYFSVPQRDADRPNLARAVSAEGSALQMRAINSIPAYVVKSRYFFALCPVIDCPLQCRVLNAMSWSRRGWCRAERASRELSEHDTWILILSSTSLQVVHSNISFPGACVGEGEFTIDSDRTKLAALMRMILSRKLRLSLQAGDFPSFRRHLNLQTVHFRDLDVEPILHPVPGFKPEGAPGADAVAHFLYQNGFTRVSCRDTGGWFPLHYAALSGRMELIEGLLLQRADPNRRATKDEPKLGFPKWSDLHLRVPLESLYLLLLIVSTFSPPTSPTQQ